MIEQDTADKILKADLANLVRKVKAGKPLSTAERKLIEKEKTAPVTAGNFAAAAAIIGCTVTQLKAAKKAGCDGFRHGRVNVPAVKEWLKENADKLPDAAQDKNALECQKLQRQIRALDFAHEQNRGLYLLADEVRRICFAHIQQARALLLAAPAELAPTLCGLTAAEIELRLVERMDAALATLRANPLGN